MQSPMIIYLFNFFIWKISVCLLDVSDVRASMAMAVLSLRTVFAFFILLVKKIKCMCVCW